MSTHQEHAIVTVDGAELEVVDLDGHEGVSRLYEITARCRSTPAVRPSKIVGGPASVALFDSYESTRTIETVVARAQNTFHDDGSVWLQLTLRPAAWLQTRGRDCRSFQDMSAVDIVTEVLSDVPHRWELARSYAIRPYTVQYREDDWTFACRLLEEEGIHYWFDHSAGSILVLDDSSVGAPELTGGAVIAVHNKSGLGHDAEVIEEIGVTGLVTPGKFAVKSFTPANPSLTVSGSSGSGALEYYDAPGGGPIDPAEAQRQAELMAGAAQAAASGVQATTKSVRPTPGRVVAPTGSVSLDGRYFITSVDYRVRQRRRDDGEAERALVCRFTGIPAATPFVPPRVVPRARQAGVQSGKVVGMEGAEVQPTAGGEVRVQQHWDRFGSGNDKGGTWMRVAQRGAESSMQLPRIGWNVITFNEEGSVDAPSVLSRVNDGEHPPAYKLPENKTRCVWKTATSPGGGSFNEIYFEDKQGAEEFFVNASRDMNVLVQNNKNEGIQVDSTRTVGVDHTLTVGTIMNEDVMRDQKVSIGANDTATVKGAQKEDVDGNFTLSIGGNRKIDVGNSADDDVAVARKLSVGAAMVELSLGTISASATFASFLVGGAQLKLSTKSVVDGHGGVSVQAIGGAKLEFAKKNRQLDAEKLFFETVGGVLMINTSENYTDVADKTWSFTVGGQLTGKAPEVIVRAFEKIEVVCGGSAIVIKTDSVEIKSPELDLSASELVRTETALVEHNG